MSEEVTEKEMPAKRNSRIRFEWLDQFRGIVIILFIVQTFAYKFSSDIILPPMVNHGYKFWDFGAGFPKIITLIDIGQQIFIFLVGFMQAFAVMKRFQKTDEKWRIFLHILFRAGLVWILAVIHVGVADGFGAWELMVYGGTLANIAWAGLAAGVAALFFKKGDFRFWIGFGLMLCTTAVWIMVEPMSPYSPLFTNDFLVSILPTLGHIEIGIIAAAVAGWIFHEDGSVNEGNWKKRVLPLALGFMVLSYLSWFIQWADHHKVNMSLSTMAIGFSSLMVFTFYKMEQVGFRAPILTPLGKNMLLVFLLSMFINEEVYLNVVLVPSGLIGLNIWYGPILDMLLAGVVPTLLMWAIMWPLHKYNLILKMSWPTGGRVKSRSTKPDESNKSKFQDIFCLVVSFIVINGIIAYGIYMLILGNIYEAILCLIPLLAIEIVVLIVVFRKK
jgi:hypothetical protein